MSLLYFFYEKNQVSFVMNTYYKYEFLFLTRRIHSVQFFHIKSFTNEFNLLVFFFTKIGINLFLQPFFMKGKKYQGIVFAISRTFINIHDFFKLILLSFFDKESKYIIIILLMNAINKCLFFQKISKTNYL